MTTQRAVIHDHLHSDFADSDSVALSSQRSVMCAPLISREGESLGALYVDAAHRGRVFAEEDLDLLSSIAFQVAQVMENAWLQKERTKKREWQRELEIARRIQFGLLPKQAPDIDGYDFFDFYSPASHIGGDYYDYRPLESGRMAVVVADVEGHGVPAALLMSKLAGEVKIQLARGLPPLEVMGAVNASFLETASDKLVTMLVLVLNPLTHEVTLVNAGHERPLLRDPSGDVEEVGHSEAGFQVGAFDNLDAGECVLRLDPGYQLVMYTDGVTDAQDHRGEMFGRTRLKSELERSDSAVLAGRRTIHAVQAFTGDCPQRDDMCLICIGRRR
jgi:serine phosphatase RsbU (regulator of sigma subunit)